MFDKHVSEYNEENKFYNSVMYAKNENAKFVIAVSRPTYRGFSDSELKLEKERWQKEQDEKGYVVLNDILNDDPKINGRRVRILALQPLEKHYKMLVQYEYNEYQ